MKTKILIILFTIGILATGYVDAHKVDYGADADDVQSVPVNSTDSKGTKAVEVGNKTCPVSGDKVPPPGEKGEMGEVVKYEYNGKVYNLCCRMCVRDFKKNPEKYSKIAEDEVKN